MAPCCFALEELGYTVSNEMVNGSEIWTAEKENQRLVAIDPCMLLGLVKLVEMRGENWRVSDEKIDGFLKRFYSVNND
jgi:hypothetical protein